MAAPFRQVSDVARGGRYVVFDSDASNLVEDDTNRDTDVFVADRRRDTIERVSVGTRGVQGDNDSFSPTITSSARFVSFQSFAANLAPNGAVIKAAAQDDGFQLPDPDALQSAFVQVMQRWMSDPFRAAEAQIDLAELKDADGNYLWAPPASAGNTPGVAVRTAHEGTASIAARIARA